MAMTIMGIIVSIALLIVGVNPKRAANEAAAIATLRTVVTAERVYSMTAGNGSYGDLGDLRAENLIDEPLAAGFRQGYNFALSKQSDYFAITATPASTRTGTRSFFVDTSGVIRCRVGGGAGLGDPPLGN